MTIEEWLKSWEFWLLLGSMIIGVFAVNLYNFWEKKNDKEDHG